MGIAEVKRQPELTSAKRYRASLQLNNFICSSRATAVSKSSPVAGENIWAFQISGKSGRV